MLSKMIKYSLLSEYILIAVFSILILLKLFSPNVILFQTLSIETDVKKFEKVDNNRFYENESLNLYHKETIGKNSESTSIWLNTSKGIVTFEFPDTEIYVLKFLNYLVIILLLAIFTSQINAIMNRIENNEPLVTQDFLKLNNYSYFFGFLPLWNMFYKSSVNNYVSQKIYSQNFSINTSITIDYNTVVFAILIILFSNFVYIMHSHYEKSNSNTI
ncbi:MAG: hypothetical protein JXR48_05115 [Candidatus Delongbacteria bacterium]|nr:hypothetical protein [Candidatus Delongbacteria bacterium]MBN2834329.1 hypothetical protein [Candidatus Delongbacteria bacterium]